MKTKSQILILSGLLLLGSCGKSDTGEKIGKAIFQPLLDGTAKVLVCATVGVGTAIGNSLAHDYDVKLYRSTIDRVLSEIKPNKKFAIKTFWADLSPESREVLNHEINLLLGYKPAINATGVYKSTAIFFAKIREDFNPNTDYKIKDNLNGYYSFRVRGQSTNAVDLIGVDCATNEGTDLSPIEVSNTVLRETEIQDIIRCQGEKEGFTLMEVRDVAYLMANKKLYKISQQDIKRDENSRRIHLDVKTPSVDMSLKIRLKREFEEREIEGKRTLINLKLPGMEINEFGACKSLKLDF